MRILSIDQSFTNSAWSIWENDKLYDFGVISSDKDTEYHERLKYILGELKKIILENEVERLVMEGLSLGINSTSVRPLSALFYCIQMLCAELDIPFDDIPPKSVKKVWTGVGNASKKDMEEACPNELLAKIMNSPFKTINKGRRDLVDSFAIYKSFKELYGKNI